MQFVDTNVLLYALSRDPAESAKAERANQILDSRQVAISCQVLQEFFAQATRLGREDRIEPEVTSRLVESFLRFPVQETTVSIVRAAIETQQRYQISYWDAAILEAARALGCDVVLSEDLNDGQDYGGVRIENPF